MSMSMDPIAVEEVVLVVIDDDLVLTLLKKKLPRYFEEIYFASNPRKAIEILDSREVTHLVIDFDHTGYSSKPFSNLYTPLDTCWVDILAIHGNMPPAGEYQPCTRG